MSPWPTDDTGRGRPPRGALGGVLEGQPELRPGGRGRASPGCRAITRDLKRIDAAAFAGSDFTLEDFRTLHALMVQPYPTEATPAQLADTAGVTRAAMTSRLDRLVAAGLVTREVDPLDRRRVVVRPTAAGRAEWDSYVHEGMRREQDLLRALETRAAAAQRAAAQGRPVAGPVSRPEG